MLFTKLSDSSYSASLDDTLREPDLTHIFSVSKEAQESCKHLSEHLPHPKSGLLVCVMGSTLARQNLCIKVLTPSTPECDCIDKELIIVKNRKQVRKKCKHPSCLIRVRHYLTVSFYLLFSVILQICCFYYS